MAYASIILMGESIKAFSSFFPLNSFKMHALNELCNVHCLVSISLAWFKMQQQRQIESDIYDSMVCIYQSN